MNRRKAMTEQRLNGLESTASRDERDRPFSPFPDRIETGLNWSLDCFIASLIPISTEFQFSERRKDSVIG
jgi:hypothetical protein